MSFDPAAWDDVAALRSGVVLAPRADDARRRLVTALDTARMHEFDLGLTVVVVDSEPCNYRGLRKYFPRQLLVQPGEHGLSADAAVGIWFLQRQAVTPPAVGGMRRETVEDRVVRRWEGGGECERRGSDRGSNPHGNGGGWRGEGGIGR